KLGELNTRMTIEDFVATLTAEYYNLIRQKIRLHNLKATLALSKERLRIVEERYYIGSMSRLDLQQAQVDFNADSSNVLNQLEIVHRSKIELNRLMALENIEERVFIKDSVIVPNAFLDEAELWNNTETSNVSLQIARKNILLSELDYKKARSRNYPYVKLNAGYGYTANWYEVGTTDLQKRLGLNYGVTIGYNLFDGFNRRREQKNTRLQIENKDLRRQEMELALKADMSNFWMAYENNLDLWSLEKENLVAAQENYAIAIERYKLGDLSGIELREAQNSLLNAEERRSIAEYATKICEISLLQLSGQLLEYLLPDE
ncbi:MAG: TolC family protein, partial [Massilibacteroides sp.]|nr:TolC family protein [Massilibacteroides sp.]